ncbi:3D (Asp-Asp-Asp) domain-containing protein [Halobacillus alkaliphilus]|uniref:3D (Asp-Asp-Asp) domain-containing protein n=1 Tax=Halobacillus alkaliphilus TaxID=396056 RepID=A0A1I2Q0M0_9BACI|nr:3D domain-containing protein [Halobacillus alkaliphilus]SFG19171.1 3D (Asp-Asp-Asp) domain-containing protein [Halobacillus alkaliphilus]
MKKSILSIVATFAIIGTTTITASASEVVVDKGDTLWGIGQEKGVSVEQLKEANDLSSNLIFPDQTLTINGDTENNTEENEENHSESEDVQASGSEESTGDDVAKKLTMEATAYTAFCEGCSGTTYTGIDLRANPDRKVIAVDPDVIPLGSEVYVEGYGKAVAGDIGGAIQNDRIDVFIPNQGDALDFGRKDVEVTVYE